MEKIIPKISVIIPVYNTEKYLRQCLDSVLNQTLKEIEVLCIDDGSTDESLMILNEYKEKDNRITVLKQEKSNAGEARNKGLSIANGEYLSFLDSDDFFHPEMLEKAYNRARKTNAEIVIFRAKRYLEDTNTYQNIDWTVKEELIPNKEEFHVSEIKEDIFSSILGYAWDKLFSRKFVEKNQLFFQEQPVFNDAYFTYSALLVAEKLTFLNEPLIYQRKRAEKESITDRRALYYDCSYKLLKELKIFLTEKNIFAQYEQDFVNYAVHLLWLDFSGKKAGMRKKMLNFLYSKCIPELNLGKYGNEYFYNPDEYEQLMNNVYPEVTREFLPLYFSDSPIEIPIVYATDHNYFRYVITSIISILQHPYPGIFNRFVILIPQGTDVYYQNILKRLIENYENCSVEFYEIGNQFDNAHLCIKHITVATYYRLMLPEILPDCDKCIYLDGDTIICNGLLELFLTQMDEKYLAGVRAYIYYDSADEHKNRLGIGEKSEFEYVNAGVLVMNLKQMRTDECVDKFLSLLDKNFDSQDQDILNLVCFGKIQILPFRFNVMTKYNKWTWERFGNLASKEEIESGRKNPAIIHYADKIKPWNDFNSPYASKWLEIALIPSCWQFFGEEKKELLVETLYSNRQVRNLKREIQNIRNSKSYRIGRVITFFPRKIRGGLHCYQEHGLRYSIQLALKKIEKKR